jgi:hypothetical protein
MAVPMSCRDRPAATPEMCLSVCVAREEYEDLFVCGEVLFMRVCVCRGYVYVCICGVCVQSEDKTHRRAQGRTGCGMRDPLAHLAAASTCTHAE